MTVVPDGEACYCGKKGCLDAYCSAKCLTEGRVEDFFGRLVQGEPEEASLWDQYTTYLAIAVNNIHMVLDCDVVLGGYKLYPLSRTNFLTPWTGSHISCP